MHASESFPIRTYEFLSAWHESRAVVSQDQVVQELFRFMVKEFPMHHRSFTAVGASGVS